MRLLRVELTRLRWRRAALLLLGLCVLLPALMWAATAWETRPVSDQELRHAQEMVEQERAGLAESRAECLEHPDQWGVDPEGDVEAQCAQNIGEPEVDWYLTRPPFRLEDVSRDAVQGLGTILIGLVLLLGATYAGADWASGSMSNQLLFESRRLRVWSAKAAAAIVYGALGVALGLAVFWTLVWGLMQTRDLSGSAEVWEWIAKASGRTVGFGAAAALGGYAITMLLRNTVGTLGAILAIAIFGSVLVAALPIEGNGRWMLQQNVLGILTDGYEYYDESIAGCSDYSGDRECHQVLTLAEGVRFFGVLLLVGLALSAAAFRRRDLA